MTGFTDKLIWAGFTSAQDSPTGNGYTTIAGNRTEINRVTAGVTSMNAMKNTDKIFIGLILITNIVFGVYRYFRLDGISTIMFINYLTMTFLPFYYLTTSKFSHITISMLCFILLPLGLLFRIHHWPSSSVLFIIGISGYLVSGVQLLLTKNKRSIPIATRIAITTLGAAALIVILKLFFNHLMNGIELERPLQSIIFLSAIFILTSSIKDSSSNYRKLSAVLLINSFLPLCVWGVDLIR